MTEQQPETMDNPATAGGDLDEPQNPNEPGGFVYQDANAAAEVTADPVGVESRPNGAPVDPQQGEPVVEPDPEAEEGAADDDAEDDGEAEPDVNPADHVVRES